mgnify:CR=1 FL=1
MQADYPHPTGILGATGGVTHDLLSLRRLNAHRQGEPRPLRRSASSVAHGPQRTRTRRVHAGRMREGETRATGVALPEGTVRRERR